MWCIMLFLANASEPFMFTEGSIQDLKDHKKEISVCFPNMQTALSRARCEIHHTQLNMLLLGMVTRVCCKLA